MKTPQQLPPHVDQILLARAGRALDVLEGRKKAVIKEHAERMKRIRHASRSIQAALLAPPEDMLVSPLSLAPELIALIENPEEGL